MLNIEEKLNTYIETEDFGAIAKLEDWQLTNFSNQVMWLGKMKVLYAIASELVGFKPKDIATNWLIYQLTSALTTSDFKLKLLNFLSTVPGFKLDDDGELSVSSLFRQQLDWLCTGARSAIYYKLIP